MKPELRARVIAEWRGLPEPAPRPDRLTSVAESIPKLMKSLGLGDRLREEEVLSAWRGIVGDFIASHSEPNKLQAGVLMVKVLQPTMHYELDRVWKTKILQKMRERFGARTVRDIRFRVG
jgi:predicted nucleic acid-binding Zn ribbon protein